MKRFFTFFFLLLSIVSMAQTGTGFYGLARTTSPAEVFLAAVDPATGQVTNISSSSLSSVINLTDAALDPYNNRYHYIGYNSLISADLTTGTLLNSVPLSNNTGVNLYFDNFRFNNSDSTLYGLSRSVEYDTVTNTYNSAMYLATVNTTTGLITNISPNSIGQGYALAGSAIDPWLKVYYYSTGANLVGLDMYTGLVYSSAPITIAGGDYFDNFTYSCADSALYGLVRTNFYDTIYNPIDSTIWNLVLDSATVRLGKIDPTSGLVTIISPSTVTQGGYSLNAGSTIDPNTMTFYYSNGAELIGVSMITGLKVSQQLLQNANGQYFDMMRIPTNCIQATEPIRPAPGVAGLNSLSNANITLRPNPVVDLLNISSDTRILNVEVLSAEGRVLLRQVVGQENAVVDFSKMQNGVYLLKLNTGEGALVRQIVK